MGERGEFTGNGKMALPASMPPGVGVDRRSVRPVPDIPVFDPWTGQNFQQHGPHTAYMRWLLQQPGDLARFRPADFHPLIAQARRAHYSRGCRRNSPMRRGEAQLHALTLGLCCGWRALDQVQGRWLLAWLESLLTCAPEPWAAAWTGSREARTLAAYCREDTRIRRGAAVEAALRRIAAAGMTEIYEDACRFESWRDVEMLLLSAWRSGISLVDGKGHLLKGWKSRFALAFAMRFPEIS